jgi:hypothetical protein
LWRTGTDGGNEEAIVGLSEGLERVLWWPCGGSAGIDVLVVGTWLIGLAGLGRAGHYLRSRMKNRVTGHMLIAGGLHGVLGW